MRESQEATLAKGCLMSLQVYLEVPKRETGQHRKMLTRRVIAAEGLEPPTRGL